MTKGEARRLFLQKRLTLLKGEKEVFEQQILEKFKQCLLKFSQKPWVLSYVPIKSKAEMEVEQIENYLRKTYNAQIALPRIENNRFVAVPHERSNSLKENTFGILQPAVDKPPLDTKQIDIVITPLLVFDKRGFRIGYGKGMYDRFLKGRKKACLIVGCSFFLPLEKIDDVEEHDIPLDLGIIPQHTYYFSKT